MAALVAAIASLALAVATQASAASARTLSASFGELASFAELEGGGEIGGTVTAAKTSAPLAGIEVCAIKSSAEAVTQCATTGASGEYAVSGLPEGEYVVEFFSLSGSYVTQYYDGKSSIAFSTKVQVEEGALTSGIDAAMTLAGRISGTVTEKSSLAPLEDIKVCVLGGGGETVLQCTSTNSHGEYTIARLPQADYAVEFYSLSGEYATQFYDEKYSFAGATRVPVSEGVLTSGIDAELVAAGKITGTVTAAGGGALEDVKVCAFASSGEATQCTSTKSSGEYTLTRLPEGLYTVEFYAYSGGYVTEYYDEKFSFAEANKVLVTGGETSSGIDAAMITTGVISGEVTEAGTAKPLEDIKVCAEEIGGEKTVLCASTNSAGDYSIVRLPPAQYIVQFFSPAAKYVTQYYDDKLSEAEAEAVTIEKGGVEAGIDATMEAATGLSGPANTEAPSISGTVAVGEVLTCAAGTWSGSPAPRFKYRWLRDGVAVAGATAETYTVQTADQGHALVCEVTASNGVYSLVKESFKVVADSPPVDVPSPPEPPKETETETGTGESKSGTGASGGGGTPTPTAGSSTGTGTPTVGVSPFTSAKAPAVSLTGSIKAKSGEVLVPLHCTATGESCPEITIELTVVETLSKGKVTAVAAKATRRKVILAKVTVTLGAGQSKTVKVALNSAGRRLLTAHGRLAVKVTVAAGASTLKTQKLTLKGRAGKKHKT